MERSRILLVLFGVALIAGIAAVLAWTRATPPESIPRHDDAAPDRPLDGTLDDTRPHRSARAVVSGCITDHQEQPIESATVCATSGDLPLALLSKPACARSQSDGSYELAVPNTRPFRLSASAPRHFAAMVPTPTKPALSLEPGASTLVDITLATHHRQSR